jgi:hypothetical protein
VVRFSNPERIFFTPSALRKANHDTIANTHGLEH